MKFNTTKLLKTILGIAVLVTILSSFVWSDNHSIEEVTEVPTPDVISPLGKVLNNPIFLYLYKAVSWKQSSLVPLTTDNLSIAIQKNRSLFKYRTKKESYTFDGLEVTRNALIETNDKLQELLKDPSANPADYFDLHQIKGKDDKGAVHFTGYYSPILKVSRKKNDVYKYPIYNTPKDWVGRLPTRGQIDTGAVLKDHQLEIAYAANLVDIYFLQVQGSGFIEFENGEQSLLSYSSNNKKPYRSIGRYMVSKGYTTPDRTSINSIKKYLRNNPDKMAEVLSANSSYVFFKEGKGAVKGSGVVPLTPGHSIAVDPKFIPLGAILLAKVPIANNRGEFLHHEYRVLFAQDTGGAINGPGHVDLFMGVGHNAKRLACNTHHYGELFLILPKSNINRP